MKEKWITRLIGCRDIVDLVAIGSEAIWEDLEREGWITRLSERGINISQQDIEDWIASRLDKDLDPMIW